MEKRNIMEIIRKTIENDEEYLRQVSKPVDFNKNDWQEAIKKFRRLL